MVASAVQDAFSSPIYTHIKNDLAARLPEFVELVTAVCQVPAPPFKEDERARFVADRFREVGLDDVTIDEEGNVVALYPGEDDSGPVLVLSAHLDTVFPEETDLTVRREGKRLYAPGIGDNSAAVASLLWIAAEFKRQGFKPKRTIAFLANVGEEGLGDLRGMRYFFNKGLGAQRGVAAALVLDGDLGTVGTQAVGSRRLSVTYRAKGGHSWMDYGNPSAVHAAGRAIAAIADIEVPAHPRSSLNVGTINGGTSVNAIAETATMLIDMRSVDPDTLVQLEKTVRARLQEAAEAESASAVDIEVVGDRPAGHIDPEHPVPAMVHDVGRRLGLDVRPVVGSTDANVPLSLGIPAVVLGTKEGEGIHTLGEYIEEDSLQPGVEFTLLSLLAVDAWLGRGEGA